MGTCEKKRLDVLLVEKGFAESRNKAQALILAGQVRVWRQTASGKEQTALSPSLIKPGTLLFENSKIEVDSLPQFVSRGGEKLRWALQNWKISSTDKVCLDVGSSTGGFTDCLLQSGAKMVYALDVGHGQMHPKLRNDPRVLLFEKNHILKWRAPWINQNKTLPNPERAAPTFAVIDVSFISIRNVLEKVSEIVKGEILALIKPQFEVGQKHLKKGIVRDTEARALAVREILDFAKEINLELIGNAPCPVLGVKGNQEEWMYVKNGE